MLVDGVPLASLGLAQVRGRLGGLAAIPQEPLFLSGSMRRSLDPLAQHADEALWAQLDKVGMASSVKALAGELDAAVGAQGGANFSVGERYRLTLMNTNLTLTRHMLEWLFSTD